MALINRRDMLSVTSSAFLALALNGSARAATNVESGPYGPLLQDPLGFLDLPRGFSYRVISRFGDRMDDGGTVPDAADGMGCFSLPDGRIALVRNHELKAKHDSGGTIEFGYDRRLDGTVLPGGTTTIVLNADTLKLEQQFRSLAGTIRNCAGGVTPWGTWLSCEEDMTLAKNGVERDHGWVFEVPANAKGLVNAAPLTAMGRFNHEAAAVDPRTGTVYMTEDRANGLLYRFLPNVPGRLAEGGRLQAMALQDVPDSRNWNQSSLAVDEWQAVRWIDLDGVDAPLDDLRFRGAAVGATLFARGEGIHMGRDELYFCCSSGVNPCFLTSNVFVSSRTARTSACSSGVASASRIETQPRSMPWYAAAA